MNQYVYYILGVVCIGVSFNIFRYKGYLINMFCKVGSFVNIDWRFGDFIMDILTRI